MLSETKFTEILVYLAGALHFVTLIGAAFLPFVLDWRGNLAVLTPFLRRLFWVYGGFIFLVVAGFGVATLAHVTDILEGDPFARSFSGFVALFWLARLLVQFFVFDLRLLKLAPFFRFGYHLFTLLFIYKVLVYGWLALR